MTSFLEACGATGPLRLAVERPGRGEPEHLTVDSPSILVGRDPSADLCLPDREISDRHLYLQVVAGRLSFLDLGSRTGTFLEGCCARSGWADRRTIRVGPYRLRLVDGVDERREPPAEDSGRGHLVLELRHRAIRSSRCTPEGELILAGSAADCPVRLVDPRVSNYHCAFLQTEAGTWVVDLLGKGGITLNGDAIRHGLVHEGDEIRLGQSLIRLRPGSWTDVATDPEATSIDSPATAIVPAHSLPALDVEALLAGQPPERVALVESLLVPLVNHFGLMQQQMFAQFRQSEMDLLRAFTESQHDQWGAIQEEVDRLHELAQEVDHLRGELASRIRPSSGRDRPEEATAAPSRLGRATRAVTTQHDPAPASGDAAGVNDVHHDPIEALPAEQRSRWRKVLGILSDPGHKATG